MKAGAGFDPRPKSFQGVLQILTFNWPLYALGVLVISVLLALNRYFTIHSLLRLALYATVALTTFWMLSSLLVSHYVYDRSHLYRWDWLATLFDKPPAHWANIHAGLDQTTDELELLFPDVHRKVLDIYNPSSMTEASIQRARRRTSAQHAESANASSLPMSNSECDGIFLIFAAHELRSRQTRQTLFVEVSRSLKVEGHVIVVEHLRDWVNFLAYGPGAFHFHSRKEWQASWRATGLDIEKEISVSPFVRCFCLRKRHEPSNHI